VKLEGVEPPVTARDVALGVVVTSGRVVRTAGRLVLLPVRVAARTPVVGRSVRRAGEELASEGRASRDEARLQLEAAADGLLAAPEVERVVDDALAGPLTDAVARSLAQHQVVERLAEEILASADLERAVTAALDHEATERLALDVLESRLAAELTDRLLRSPEFERLVEQAASSPAVRTALARQTTSMADELATGLRRRAERLDDAVERVVRRVLRRPFVRDASSPFAGVATRAAALVIDVVTVNALVLVGAGLLGLVSSLVGDLGPDALVAALVASAWALVDATYFVVFWTATGQTPGMRFLRLRVAGPDGAPPALGRSLLRLVGSIAAIVPLFGGFVPVLIDRRRRALQDFVAGTVVLYADRAPAVDDAAAPVADPARSPASARL
jgi:uncharacterized RDD family membrane protein YckC